jgi:hypothetical protein
MAEAQKSEPGTDRDPAGFESSEELCERMRAVLSWIANGEPARFHDYARVAGQTADEVKAALAQRKANGNVDGANAIGHGRAGDETGALVRIRRQAAPDPSPAPAHP